MVTSAEEWDTHWWVIFSEATPIGYTDEQAAAVADREMSEQFGPRPEGVDAKT